jgi:hypothetical protein
MCPVREKISVKELSLPHCSAEEKIATKLFVSWGEMEIQIFKII